MNPHWHHNLEVIVVNLMFGLCYLNGGLIDTKTKTAKRVRIVTVILFLLGFYFVRNTLDLRL